MGKGILVIGGGIVGLSTAYFLQREGFEVTVVDRSAMDAGASYVNAGYLTPSHIVPLAAPGVMKQGLKWMFNSASPLYIKPRLNPDFLRWAWAFNKSCTQANVDRSIRAIRDINLMSRELFSEIRRSENLEFQLERKGLLMLCQTEKMLDHEIELVELANSEGLEAEAISMERLRELEPDCELDVIGAVHYGCDGHTTPTELMADLKRILPERGVEIHKEETITDIVLDGSRVRSVHSDKQTYEPDQVVLAAGSWSSRIARQIGLRLLLEGGKGYRINAHADNKISMPAILCEAKAAVTPMRGFTRFAGTMEIAGINHKIRKERVAAIAAAARRYYPNVQITAEEEEHAQCGLRPVSPDGMAYIGRSEKCDNLIFATGHAMMGWSMGPATGKLVTEIASGKPTSMDLTPFHPDRRF
jgi:D-amino-acid dehydrogenase